MSILAPTFQGAVSSLPSKTRQELLEAGSALGQNPLLAADISSVLKQAIKMDAESLPK